MSQRIAWCGEKTPLLSDQKCQKCCECGSGVRLKEAHRKKDWIFSLHTYDPPILLLGISPEELKEGLKHICTPTFITILFTNNQKVKTNAHQQMNG